jgi:hypothetical protein
VRSIVLTVLLFAGTIAFVRQGWSYGVRYQGQVHAATVVAYQGAAMGALGLLFAFNRRAPSVRSNLRFHVALFSWLAFCAFPWMGET